MEDYASTNVHCEQDSSRVGCHQESPIMRESKGVDGVGEQGVGAELSAVLRFGGHGRVSEEGVKFKSKSLRAIPSYVYLASGNMRCCAGADGRLMGKSAAVVHGSGTLSPVTCGKIGLSS